MEFVINFHFNFDCVQEMWRKKILWYIKCRYIERTLIKVFETPKIRSSHWPANWVRALKRLREECVWYQEIYWLLKCEIVVLVVMVVNIPLALLICTLISHKIGYAKVSRNRVCTRVVIPCFQTNFSYESFTCSIFHEAESFLRS